MAVSEVEGGGLSFGDIERGDTLGVVGDSGRWCRGAVLLVTRSVIGGHVTVLGWGTLLQCYATAA